MGIIIYIVYVQQRIFLSHQVNNFLACDEAKYDIPLFIFVLHRSNVIDNITTKQTITFNEVKCNGDVGYDKVRSKEWGL